MVSERFHSIVEESSSSKHRIVKDKALPEQKYRCTFRSHSCSAKEGTDHLVISYNLRAASRPLLSSVLMMTSRAHSETGLTRQWTSSLPLLPGYIMNAQCGTGVSPATFCMALSKSGHTLIAVLITVSASSMSSEIG